MIRTNISISIFALLLLQGSSPALAKTPVILDTDIGSNVSDAFALGLVLAHPEVELLGVTTVGSNSQDRAWMVCRFLTAVGKKEIPVAWSRNPLPKRKIDWQIQYRRHPGVIFNRTSRPIKKDAVEFLYQQLKAQPGKITLLCTGPLTNIRDLLKKHPDCKPWIKQIVFSEGAHKKKNSENLDLDYKSFKEVVNSGVSLLWVGAGKVYRLDEPFQQKMFQACTPLTYQIQSLVQLSEAETNPHMVDSLAAMVLVSSGLCQKIMIRFGTKEIRKTVNVPALKFFAEKYLQVLKKGKPVLPRANRNYSKLIPNEGFPNRVHAFEDYETDIEKRWWMSGKQELKIVPPGSKRACRGVLTQDFDAKMGDLKTMYTAVIFNPVPGPPMGKNPRLRFRYWLKGTDELRVQIYSLSNGYHRYLALKGLPQKKWQTATVDMTKVRRPDGSGGPLSENERIDDIQFYTDPRAELVIDDVVLYDAPKKGETKPFPEKLQFTGWFDTGRQGREWPGDYAFAKEGYFWRAAKSVALKPKSANGLRIKVRGLRPLGPKTELFFRYHLTGGKKIRVLLRKESQVIGEAVVDGLQMNKWAEKTLPIQTRDTVNLVDEIEILVQGEGELLLDDLLLYSCEQE